MEIAKEAVALDPTEADHKAALGKAFSALKLRKLATAEFEKAVALTPRELHDPFLRCHGAVSGTSTDYFRHILTAAVDGVGRCWPRIDKKSGD